MKILSIFGRTSCTYRVYAPDFHRKIVKVLGNTEYFGNRHYRYWELTDVS